MIRWILDYWYIPLIAALAAVGWVLVDRLGTRVGSPLLPSVMGEVAAIGAKREAREIELRAGTEAARRHVRDKYRADLERLNAEAALHVKELEDDPAALAAYLDRIAYRRRS